MWVQTKGRYARKRAEHQYNKPHHPPAVAAFHRW